MPRKFSNIFPGIHSQTNAKEGTVSKNFSKQVVWEKIIPQVITEIL